MIELSRELEKYLEFVNLPYSINSNFIMIDLEKIIYTATFKNDYKNKIVSEDMINLLGYFKKQNYSSNIYVIENKKLYHIFKDDKVNYSAQMFIPIYKNKEVIGMAIFFREYGNYIESSSKAPLTIRNFIQELL